jgi:hypothetical protein
VQLCDGATDVGVLQALEGPRVLPDRDRQSFQVAPVGGDRVGRCAPLVLEFGEEGLDVIECAHEATRAPPAATSGSDVGLRREPVGTAARFA